ncbi:MAG: DNA-directed RNA polymerase subunit alpha [Candidatus Dojkabacteria bacterium]|nr:DNA-directed RNA polymerase subunit alpha [Candidatus Dojkabacteria bacterium]
MIDLSDIRVEVVESGDTSGVFRIGPLPRGYGHTFVNPIRRVLLSSLQGGGVTSMRIDGVEHEYSTIKGVKENVVEIQMNIKAIRFDCQSSEPQVVRLKKKGVGIVTAGDLDLTESVSVMEPSAEIATITDKNITLEMELVVERGIGYRKADESLRSEVGRLPMHADFSPVERVTFSIESARKGKKMDLDSVLLSIYTDGSINPQDALGKAAEILKAGFEKIFVLSGIEPEPMPVVAEETASAEGGNIEALNWLVEDLPISKRAKSRLLEAGIEKVSDVVEQEAGQLLAIPGFGDTALKELKDVLQEYGLTIKQ